MIALCFQSARSYANITKAPPRPKYGFQKDNDPEVCQTNDLITIRFKQLCNNYQKRGGVNRPEY